MDVLLQTKKLTHALTIVSRVVGKKESLPVLSCILFKTGKGGVTLQATNLESGISYFVPAKIEAEGTVAVPAVTILQLFKNAQGEQVKLSVDGGVLLIKTNNGSARIKTIPHEEFPYLTPPKEGTPFTLPRTALIEGIRSVSYAASVSTIRPEFSSVFITQKDDFLTFVSTDSFRLAEKKIKHQDPGGIPDTLIPAKNASDITYLLETIHEDSITCSITESQIHIETKDTSFMSRVIDAQFPDYESIIPKKPTTEALILKEDLSVLLQKARAFAGQEQYIQVHIYPQKKIYTATAQSDSIGEMDEQMEVAASGEDVDIKFNISYIHDALQSFGTDSVKMNFFGQGKPLVMQGAPNTGFTYLVMPLNR
ncbi:MAG: DNA polymerase III subunit beta [Patescibacteria group bacterium]